MSGIISSNIGLTSGLIKTIPAGGNTPAFFAQRGALDCSGDGCSTALSDNVWTKGAFNGEYIDTDSCYDSSSNYRFTPNKAGKYFIFAKCYMGEHQDRGDTFDAQLRFNGNEYQMTSDTYDAGFQSGGYDRDRDHHIIIQGVKEFNGTSDYVECWCKVNQTSSYARLWGAGQSYYGSYFGGYKI